MAVSISSNSKFPKVFELKLSLRETSPVVWRTFLVHEIIPLDEIHMLIQMTMGWDDKQSYEFKFGAKSYGPADLANDAGFDSDDGVSLQEALGGSNEFTYIYDHGDLWEHEVRIAQVLEHNPNITYPV
ncbi:MAG: plasmid pRiA4b ORF-3 family protein, partial [Proteobacteria bacterium]